jgi:hypothetical protein
LDSFVLSNAWGLAGCKATPVKRLPIILMAVASLGISDHTFRWHRYTDNSMLLDDDQYGVCHAHISYTIPLDARAFVYFNGDMHTFLLTFNAIISGTIAADAAQVASARQRRRQSGELILFAISPVFSERSKMSKTQTAGRFIRNLPRIERGHEN